VESSEKVKKVVEKAHGVCGLEGKKVETNGKSRIIPYVHNFSGFEALIGK
jgi:hypothetical protein